MDRNREAESGGQKTRPDRSKPAGKDRAPPAQAERDVAAAKNPVGNGQGDAQADDPKNEMHATQGPAKRDRQG
jgi:hypothetical protein